MHFADAKGLLVTRGGHTGMNVYRGCTHGCVYCDSRSACYRFAHPFEDIEVKRNAPELLDAALGSKRKKCMIGTGAMSDPYQPAEEQLRLTRRCLEIILRHGFGATVQTKSDLVLRDLDVFTALNRETRAVVQITLTCADDALSRVIEPAVTPASRRIEALRILGESGIPTVVWLCPVLPFLTDTEENIAAVLDACVRVGVKGIVCFGMGMTLREGSREHYYAFLDRRFPGLKEKYVRLYGDAYEIPSPESERLTALFRSVCRKAGILHTPEDCFDFLGRFPEKNQQLTLFGS